MNHRFSPITLGTCLKSMSANGFTLTETAHQPNCKLLRHYHEHANIAFILTGSFIESLDGRRFECSSQSLIVKAAGEAHANQYGREGMRGFLIEVQPKKLESLHPLSKILNRVDHVRGSKLSMLAMRIYRELRIMDSASTLSIEGLTLEIIAELSRRSDFISERKPPRWLEWAKDILHAHFSESLSLVDVARRVNVHPVHLAREFRKFYGDTLGEYLRQVRIEFASHELTASDISLVEISLAAGFSHQAHFSRVFKRHTGMTPSEFRWFHRTR